MTFYGDAFDEDEFSPLGYPRKSAIRGGVELFQSGLLVSSTSLAAGMTRAVVIPSGFTAERLVTGEADLAVQQISELMQVAAIEVVGPIPRALQIPAVFSAGRIAASADVDQADRLLRYLASPEVAPVLRDCGLEP